MRALETFLLLFMLVCGLSAIGPNPNSRNLILTEQELRFAGSALREVLATNVNSYVSLSLLKIHQSALKLLMVH